MSAARVTYIVATSKSGAIERLGLFVPTLLFVTDGEKSERDNPAGFSP